MAQILSEYHRFLAHLAHRHVHDDVRRLAHLVLDHLQPLADIGAVRRGRSTRLAPLAIAHLAQMPVAYDGDARGPQAGPALGSAAPTRSWAVPGIHAPGDVRPQS